MRIFEKKYFIAIQNIGIIKGGKVYKEKNMHPEYTKGVNVDKTEPPRPPELDLKEKVTPDLHNAIRRMILHQMEENAPPEVEKTLTHLLEKGHTREGAMDLLCSILVMELYNVFKNQTPFNEEHYLEVLQEFWK